METLSQTNKQMLTTSTLFNISFMKQIYPQYTNIGTVWTVSADLEFCSTGSSQSLQPICLFSSQPLLCITSPLRLITHPDVLFYEELRQRGDHKKQNFKTKKPHKTYLKKKTFLHIHMCFLHTEIWEQKFKVDFHYFVCDNYYFTLWTWF